MELLATAALLARINRARANGDALTNVRRAHDGIPNGDHHLSIGGDSGCNHAAAQQRSRDQRGRQVTRASCVSRSQVLLVGPLVIGAIEIIRLTHD